MDSLTRTKKIFLILGFLALVILIGYFIWRFFFLAPTEVSPTATTTPGQISGLPSAGPGTAATTTGPGGPGGLPTGTTTPVSGAPAAGTPTLLATGGVTKTKTLTASPTLDPTLTASGQVQYYDKNDGHFYKIGADGQATLLSDKVFYDVENIVWAPSEDKAILEYPDGNKILYNFQTKEQVTLPNYWEDFSFSPGGDSIVAKSIGLDVENRWLTVANDDGSGARNLENIGENGNTVYSDWSPSNQVAAYYTKGVDFDRQEVYFVGLNDENFKSTVIEGRGLQAEWSTTGDRLLYSVYNASNNYNPSLWVVEAQGDNIGQNRTSINLNTWADKCTFASNTEVYCAVPESLPAGAGLFPELADQTKDNLYKIDLTTGVKKLIAVPEGSYNISQVMVTESQDYIYFTDKTTEQIYQVRLK